MDTTSSRPNWPTQLFVDGRWLDSQDRRTLAVTNPATGEQLAEVALAGASDVAVAVQAARRAFDDGPWPQMDPLRRGRLLFKLAEKVRENLAALALTDTLNVGKPIRDTVGFDIPCAADLLESYAGLSDKVSGKCFGCLPDNVSLQLREPMGVVAAIVPWNFPLTNAAIKLAPILACGNCVILKPSEIAPLSALMLAQMAADVGFPPGVINVVNGLGPEAGQALIEHPGVDKISFTGRHATGQAVLEAAKQGMKGVVLELGGKTPSLVFPDAPLEHVVNGIITGIFLNLGQVCVAGSRLLVHRSQHDELLAQIVAKVRGLRQGDPTDPNMHLGCIATPLHLKTVERYVARAAQEGARKVIGGGRRSGPEFRTDQFYEPTVFDGVESTMTIAREEVFGPVLSVITFDDEDEAVRLANDCEFGLMANIWTTDGGRALRLARRIRAGRIAINGGGYLRGNLPVYGYKLSGVGAELGFDEAVHEFTNSKAVLYSMAVEKSAWPEP